MPIFTRKGSARPQPITGYSLVDEHTTVHGDLETAATVRVDGRVEGHLHRAGVLIVGASGVVAGDVQASEVVLAGHIEGSVIASGRMEIHASGVVHGDIVTAAMMLQEGGVIEGRVQVQSESGAASGSPVGLAAAGAGDMKSRGSVDAYAAELPRRAMAG